MVSIDPSQKFCTNCGAELPSPQSLAPVAGQVTSLKWLVAGIGIVVIIAVALVLVLALPSGILSAVPAGSSAPGQDPAGTGSALATPIITTLPPETTVPATPESITVTTTATTVPATTVPVTLKRTRVSVTPRETVSLDVNPTLTELSVASMGSSQITLATTLIPTQPAAGSYLSSNPEAPVIEPSALEARIHELINVQRNQNGLSTLGYDSFLASIARGHSWDMVVRNFFEHENPDGLNARARGEAAGYPCRKDYGTYYTEGLSENLYQGYRYNNYWTAPNGTIVKYEWNTLEQVAEQAVNGWMNSEGHRKNIVDTHFTQEGIGVAFSTDEKIYVTENFC
jgi:uncharacterized protein YkwD